MTTILKDYVPGQKQLSAAQLNELVGLVKALAGLQTGEGLQLDRVGGAYQLTREEKEPGFWAKITGEGTSSLAGKYAWTEQTDASGSFANLTGGRSGTVNGVSGATTTVEPLREANGATGVPTDTIVWVIEGTPTVDTATTGDPIDSHYRFEYPAPAFALEYLGYRLDTTFDHSGTADTWEEITGFQATDPTYSGTYLKFPSTGIWQVDFHIFGSITIQDSSSAVAAPLPFFARVSEVSGASDLLAADTGEVGGLIVYPSYHPATTSYYGYGSLHFTAIFSVATANTKGVLLEVAWSSSGAVGNVYASVYPSGPFTTDPGTTTAITMTKLSD